MKRMERRMWSALAAAALLAAGMRASAQAPDAPPAAPPAEAPAARLIRFNLKDASVDTLLKYVSEQLGVTIVKEAKVEGTVTAVSTEGIPEDQALSFVDTVLKAKGVTTLRLGDIVKIVDIDEAKRRNIRIFVGGDPDAIVPSDTIITQIIPLKYALAVEIQKELATVVAKTGELAANARSNTLVLTDTAANIHRFVRIIKELDRQLVDAARIRVYFLKYAEARAIANVLNEIFGKNEQARARAAQGGGNPFQMLFGGGGGGPGGRPQGGGPGPNREPTPRMEIQIASDIRTNSVIVIASEDYHGLVKEVIDRLDVQMADILQVRVYPLQHADAQDTVRLLKEIFRAETSASASGAAGAPSGGVGGSPQERFARFFAMQGGGGPGGGGGGRGGALFPNQRIDVTADPRTNSVIIAASKEYHELVKGMIDQLDAQMSNLLRVRIYRLKNADAVETANIIRTTFRPASSRLGGTGASAPAGGAGGLRTGAIPSEVIEVSADERTNMLIVKATEDNLREIELLVERLDEDKTEPVTTFVYPLKNAAAGNVANVLSQLLRGMGGTAAAPSGARSGGGASSGRATGTGGRPGGTSSGRSSGLGGRSGGSGPRMAPDNAPDGPDGAPDADTADPNPDAGDGPEGPGAASGVVGDIDIRADADSNSVLIRTSPRNVAAVQRLLDEMDRVRRQVLIKVLIAEVTLDDTLRFGVEGFWENGVGIRGGDLATGRLSTDFPGALTDPGLTYRLTGDELDVMLQALNRDGRLKVLSTPRVLVLDNEQANITVGRDVPEVVNTRLTDQGSTLNTIQRREIGILLQVTPRINPDGLVTMTVHPEVSVLAPQSESVEISEGVTAPVIERNSADTTVAAAHGQTVVIGGLIRESDTTTVNKTPVVGDIPLVGLFFRHEEKRTQKTELMIFLTPYVVNNAEELKELSRLEQAQLKLIAPGDIQRHADTWEFEPRE
jgi:general secretion pathway protein D